MMSVRAVTGSKCVFFRGFLDSCFSQVLIEGMMGEKEGSEVGDTRSAVRIGLASGRWRREE